MNLVRYFLVGGCAAVVDFSLFAVATLGLGINWFPSAAFAFLVATAVNYILSITFVFESGIRFSRSSEWAVVLVASGCGLALNQGILWGLIETAGLNILVAKVCATGSVFLWNYSVRRYYVFAPKG